LSAVYKWPQADQGKHDRKYDAETALGTDADGIMFIDVYHFLKYLL